MPGQILNQQPSRSTSKTIWYMASSTPPSPLRGLSCFFSHTEAWESLPLHGLQRQKDITVKNQHLLPLILEHPEYLQWAT